MSCIVTQSAGVSEYGLGRQASFLSSSLVRVASTYPVSAAPKHGNPTRVGRGRMASGSQIGTSRGYARPEAAQCTTSARRGTWISPSSKRTRPGATERTCPRRTTFEIVRSRSISHIAIVGAFAMVGVTVSIDAEHDSARLEAEEEVVGGLVASRRRGHRVGGHAQEDGWIGLHDGAIEHPRIARTDPADRLRIHAVLQQPDAGIRRGLPGADDHVLLRRLIDAGQVVDRDHPGAVLDDERRGGEERNGRREVAGIDDPGARRSVLRAAQERTEAARRRCTRTGEEGRPVPWRRAPP